MIDVAITLGEDDVASYRQQFRMAVRSANDYANKRTGFATGNDPLTKNQFRAQFLDSGKIDKIEQEGQNKNLPGYTAAAKALHVLAAQLMTSKAVEAPSTDAPPVKIIEAALSPS